MKKKIIKCLLIILVIIAGGLAGVLTYLNKPKKIDINSELVQSLYKTVNPSDDAYVLSKFYEKPEEFENEYILTTAIKMYIDSQNGENVETIPRKDIEENIYKLFGKDIKFKHDTVYVMFGSYCMFRYDDTKKLYILVGGCDGSINHLFYRKVVAAEETQKELIIYEKLIYVNYEWDDIALEYGYVTIYNNTNDKKIIKTYDHNPREPLGITIDDYLNDASTYKYIFEKDNNNYIFKKIQLVK